MDCQGILSEPSSPSTTAAVPIAHSVVFSTTVTDSPAQLLHLWTSRLRSEKVSRADNDGKSIHVALKMSTLFNLELRERDDETDRKCQLTTSLVLAVPSLH